MKNSLSVVAVIAVGTAGWAIAWQGGVWKPVPDDANEGTVALGAKILGYASAVCYLGYVLIPNELLVLWAYLGWRSIHHNTG